MIVEPCNTTEQKDSNDLTLPLSWDEIHCEEGVYACRYSNVRFIVLKAVASDDETVVLYYNGMSLQPALNHVWEKHRFRKLDETVCVSFG